MVRGSYLPAAVLAAALHQPLFADAAATDMSRPLELQVSTEGLKLPHLVDGRGMSVYLFARDRGGSSTCVDECFRAWPPVAIFRRQIAAGPGIDAQKIGRVRRPGGTEQVTYAGWPLYYYYRDAAVGDVRGERVQDFGAAWYLMSPSGTPIAKVAPEVEANARRQSLANTEARLGRLAGTYGTVEAALLKRPERKQALAQLQQTFAAAARAVTHLDTVSVAAAAAAASDADDKLDRLEAELNATQQTLKAAH